MRGFFHLKYFLLFFLCSPAFADHESAVFYRAVEEDWFSTPEAACVPYVENRQESYDGWTVYLVEIKTSASGSLFCSTAMDHNTENLTGRNTASIILQEQTEIIEHDDDPSCDVDVGIPDYSFTYYYDGDTPDLTGLTCLNNCSVDVTVTTVTEYGDNFGTWEPVSEHYTVSQQYNGSDCSDDFDYPDYPTTPDDLDEEDEGQQCTSDYYTSPTTGEIVCGTPPQTTTSEDGTTTTTETNEDGSSTTTTTTPDGTTTTEEKASDGTTTTTTTDSNGDTTSTTSATDDGEDEEEECKDNVYTLVDGAMVCSSTLGGASSDDIVSTIEEGNVTLTEIRDLLTIDLDAVGTHEFTEVATEVADKKEEFTTAVSALIDTFKEATAVTLQSTSYSCNRSFSALGETFSFCMPPESLEVLAQMGLALVFLAHLFGLIIILRF